MKKSELREMICEEIQKLNEEQKYSTVEKDIRGFTFLVYYPDKYGNETESGLFDWEAKDRGNREIQKAKDRKEADKFLKSFRR